MLATIAVGLTLMSSAGKLGAPQVLEPKAACRLAKRTKFPSGRIYSIAGVYASDGMHLSEFELPACDMTLRTVIGDDARATIAAFHDAFREKCGGNLMGDHFSGTFTGTITRKSAHVFGMSRPMPVNFFVVNTIQTKDGENPVVCPK